MPFQKLQFEKKDESDLINTSKHLLDKIKNRRTVRDFSDDAVPTEAIENAVRIAVSAPSGANKEPWTFVIVTQKEMKKKIRIAAEKEEKEFYTHRATREWLKDLNPFETNWHKPFLETAPCLIVVFKQIYEFEKNSKRKNYYVNESVGIATGFLLMALHQIGLVTLTHTPSPMGFLEKILNRPNNERAFLLIPVGLPAKGAQVPVLKKKPFSETVRTYY
jgi:nitroreductase|tara:strand:- start:1955 stop:2611 length:657 start_codon:yes stop_codon:yes gene_type:complete